MFVENFLKIPSNSSYSSAASASLSGKLPGIEEELEMNESSIIQTHETMLHSPGTPERTMAVGGDPMRTPVKLFEPIAEFGRHPIDWDTDSEDDMHNEYIPPEGVAFGASPPLVKKARRSDISHSSDDSDSSLQSPVQRYARPVLSPPNAPLRVRRKRPQNKEFHLKPVRLIDLIEAELHDERMDRLSSAMSSATTDEQRDSVQNANASRSFTLFSPISGIYQAGRRILVRRFGRPNS
ncbi:hypothetical protein WR25_08579 [Diploscapter pachys]|uniref:Uncharacterized protein n=1 Tax=Diploscapter pachys TaxID=2018661 RepID=A0A2A2JLD6_9BILA|nr:hypothetical protein WR25_08579 [Diploscapter pachys]